MDNLLLTEQFVAFESDRPNLVLRSFRNREVQNEIVGLGVLESGLLELHVDVALVGIELPELVLVFLEDIVLEAAGTSDPREYPPTAGLNDLAQLALLERGSVLEEHLLDFDLGRFLHLKGHDSATEGLGDARFVVDRGPLEARLLVHLEDDLGVIEELALVHRLAALRSEFLAKL